MNERQHLLLISLIDQSEDVRDTGIYSIDVCDEATAAGVDMQPALREAGKLSSDENRYGMGSLKKLLLGTSR